MKQCIWLGCLGLVLGGGGWANETWAQTATGQGMLGFRPAGDGGFLFDTGRLRGRLRAGGEAVGLTEVYTVPGGERLDRSKGLLSHYRVFTKGKRYGTAAWDWPGSATLRSDGSVEVRWLATEERPFNLRARYRWRNPVSIEVETEVEARAALVGFESFLASYFDPAFYRASVRVAGGGIGKEPRLLAATRDLGEWQIYPRDEAAEALIRDGRWALEPHPVEWAMPARLGGKEAVAIRRAPDLGLSAEIAAPLKGCFALATPHETEGHFSTYVSLFGRDFRQGESARAKVTLTFQVRAISRLSGR